jgi:NADPH:quinone reductase-like Zn-dependent oxidoreductase
MRKSLAIQGYTLFDVVADPAKRAVAQQYVFDKLAAGVFTPRIAKTFPLSQVADAQRYMESNEQVGKVVVTVAH